MALSEATRPLPTPMLRAFSYAWLLISGLILLVLISPFVARESVLLEAGRLVQAPHEKPCVLCGMTRGFVSISAGDFARARELNPNAPAFYILLVLNEVLAAAWIAPRIAHGAKRRLVHADA